VSEPVPSSPAVLAVYSEWINWCEREGVDPEVMTFEAWIEEMRRADATQ
jgi:hypothetical protein